MAPRTIAVVGGAFAGPIAAARAREIDDKARIILLERNRSVDYAACGIAQHVSREAAFPDSLQRRRVEELRDLWRVEVRTGAEVDGIDVARRTLRIGRERLAWNSVVYAAGVESVLPDVPDLEGAQNLVRFRTPSDADAVFATRAAGRRRVVVVGAGLMGVEAADALARGGLDVVLLERKERILPDFAPVASALAADGLADAGVRIITRARLRVAHREGDDITFLEVGRAALRCDLVVIAAGVVPRTGLLAQAGAALTKQGAVVIDERCATSLPDIYACGTCVAVTDHVSERPLWSAQAAIADRTAQVAGACAAGGEAHLLPLVVSAIVRAGDMTIGRTGMTRTQARARAKDRLGITTIEAPGTDPVLGGDAVAVELLHEGDLGLMLGADVAGRTGIPQRLAALAAALRGGLLVDDLAEVDLGYAPPYSPVRDPVNVAGTVALATLIDRTHAVLPEDAARGRALLVDVRDGSARRDAPAGSRHVPLATLRETLRSLPASRRLVFVDDTGRLGYLASRIARCRGRKDAAYLNGGLRAWRAAGLRLVGTP
jgi:NADPH-dependent 2,4-dienoyl-CoA reductase/sulfur reductase-like enzyme/rhodanese-related sulfurtransferase